MAEPQRERERDRERKNMAKKEREGDWRCGRRRGGVQGAPARSECGGAPAHKARRLVVAANQQGWTVGADDDQQTRGRIGWTTSRRRAAALGAYVTRRRSKQVNHADRSEADDSARRAQRNAQRRGARAVNGVEQRRGGALPG
ncbi:hypothetical protein Scep_022113 [Stephania cephalantha]|uniref:Uncharacterized protein n=1 Tax=Stephania cephalantha TaxID=152367 RepID=A0AAP0I2E2_9MAGN